MMTRSAIGGWPLRLAAFLVFTLVSIGLSAPVLADKRVALVIGNAHYRNVAELENPMYDASALAEALRQIGFDKVMLKLNLDYGGLRRSLGEFSRISAGAEIAIVYFAGHGIEIGGVNYVIPVDAKLRHADDAAFEAVPLDIVLSSLNRADKLKLVVLDACRNNPFRQKMSRKGSTRSVGRGFSRVSPQGSDTLVAYAAREGTTADDGSGRHSPYTNALLKHIITPGLDVRLMFGRVRDEVLESTGRRQEPYTYGSLGGSSIQLNRVPGPAPSAAAPDAGGGDKIQSGQTEAQRKAAENKRIRQAAIAAAWSIVRTSTDEVVLNGFIAQFPGSPYVDEARKRIKELAAKRKLAALAPAPETFTSPRELAKALQAELNRVGCKVGRPDGSWGKRSRRGLSAFASFSQEKLASFEPSLRALQLVKRRKNTVCPGGCGSGYVLRGSRCVAEEPATKKKIKKSAINTSSSNARRCRLETLSQCRVRIRRLSDSQRRRLPGAANRKCAPELRKQICK